MSDTQHDPGIDRAKTRADSNSFSRRFTIGSADVRVGTAGWTDRTLTARGVFYPGDAKTPEARLRYYASRFSMVEADVGFYAIPDRTGRALGRAHARRFRVQRQGARADDRTCDGCRTPSPLASRRDSRDLGPRVYAKDLP